MFQCNNNGCFASRSNWFFPILPLDRICPLLSRKWEICRVFLFVWTSFSNGRDFIFSTNNLCCSNLKIVALAFSFSSIPVIFVAIFVLLKALCTYVIVFTSQMKLPNCSHWTIYSFSLVVEMKADCSFCSSEANSKFTCSGHSLSDYINQAGPVSHLLLLSWSTSMALAPMLAGLLIPLTSFHCETSVVSKNSATRLATKNYLTAMTAVCNSKRGIERCLNSELSDYKWYFRWVFFGIWS